MGNIEMHGLGPPAKSDQKELDLSQPIDFRYYFKHVAGEYSNACLKEIPSVLLESVHLHTELNLSFNCLQLLPKELPSGLPHLTSLNIMHNQLTSLPETVHHLFHLQELLLSHNYLSSLPQSLTLLSRLEKLDVSYNQLYSLPETMGYLEVLKKLNVSHNNLKCLPKSLGNIQTLEIVLATANSCEETPPQSICDRGSGPTVQYLKNLATTKSCNLKKKNKNVFVRVRSNNVKSPVPNQHSAIAEYVQKQTETMNTASRIRTPLIPPIDSTDFNPEELRDHLIGLIYGAAIGDALGIGTEFLTPDECKFHYDKETFSYRKIIQDEHRSHWTRGDWTSNFDQMLLILDSLLNWAGVIDELEFAKCLVSWKQDGISELGSRESYMYSNTINLVLQDSAFLKNPHHVAENIWQNRNGILNGSSGTDSCDSPFFIDSGALPRSIILGIPHFHDIHEVISNSVRICKSTHHDERCVASSVALSVAISLMLKGHYFQGTENTVNDLLQLAESYGATFITEEHIQTEFKEASEIMNIESIALTEVGKISHTFKPFATAFWALRQKEDFRSIMNSILMQGGYSSMTGCIAGAFLGCKCGFSKLPKDWVVGLQFKNQKHLNAKINALLDMMALP